MCRHPAKRLHGEPHDAVVEQNVYFGQADP